MIKARNKKVLEHEQLEITALLDIIVILLVFLLHSIHNAELTVNVISSLALPMSSVTTLPHQGIVVQVNNSRVIFVDNEVVGKIDANSTIHMALYNSLKSRYDKIFESENVSKATKPKVSHINLLMDKQLTYKEIHVILRTAAKAGFGKYKLIVQGPE